MSWKDKVRDFLRGETSEKQAAREAELAAHRDRLTRKGIMDSAITAEQTKLKMEQDAELHHRPDRSKALSDVLGRIREESGKGLDTFTEDIYLRGVSDPAKKEELKRLRLQTAEGYWVNTLSQPKVSTGVARFGNQRLKEIRTQLNPPQPGKNPQ